GELDQRRRLESSHTKPEIGRALTEMIDQRTHHARRFACPIGYTRDDFTVVAMNKPLPWRATRGGVCRHEDPSQIGVELTTIGDRNRPILIRIVFGDR